MAWVRFLRRRPPAEADPYLNPSYGEAIVLHLSQRPVLIGAAALALACVLSPLASAQQERRTVTDTK